MTDATLIVIVGTITTTIQAISVAWLRQMINTNGCGGGKCADVIKRLTEGGKDIGRANKESPS